MKFPRNNLLRKKRFAGAGSSKIEFSSMKCFNNFEI